LDGPDLFSFDSFQNSLNSLSRTIKLTATCPYKIYGPDLVFTCRDFTSQEFEMLLTSLHLIIESSNSPESYQWSTTFLDPTSGIISWFCASQVLTTLSSACPKLWNHEMLIFRHVPFLVPMARIDLVTLDLCMMLNFTQLYDIDRMRVANMNFEWNLLYAKLNLLSHLIWVHIRPL
jgi:hypothetical protein